MFLTQQLLHHVPWTKVHSARESHVQAAIGLEYFSVFIESRYLLTFQQQRV
jgi:hypothetical protein